MVADWPIVSRRRVVSEASMPLPILMINSPSNGASAIASNWTDMIDSRPH